MVFGIVLAGKSFANDAAKVDASAEAVQSVTVTLKNHVFEPSAIEVPADKKIALVVTNSDATPEEFESHDLHREKVIAAGATATINVGRLKPGIYKFAGEYNEKTAHGTITVK
ncbi:MAG: cupredoxin domain-containing protein [Alphaproteobacteria bacterium]|nr:cupredoxin domain-containing protein [Alphaproteobacteria bacterium]